MYPSTVKSPVAVVAANYGLCCGTAVVVLHHYRKLFHSGASRDVSSYVPGYLGYALEDTLCDFLLS